MFDSWTTRSERGRYTVPQSDPKETEGVIRAVAQSINFDEKDLWILHLSRF